MNTAALTRDQLSELRIRNNRIKRERELKRNIFLFILSIITLFGLLFLITTVKSVASTGETKYKYYTDVTVKRGDSLSGIVLSYVDDEHSYDDIMKEVVFMNNIEDENSIKAGTVLVIPYYDTLNQ